MKSRVAKTKSATKPDVAGGPPAKPADSKLNNELTVVSITESQGEPSLHMSYMHHLNSLFPVFSQEMNMDT